MDITSVATEDGLRLVKLFMQLTDRENRNKVIALAERLVAEQVEKSSGATPPDNREPL